MCVSVLACLCVSVCICICMYVCLYLCISVSFAYACMYLPVSVYGVHLLCICLSICVAVLTLYIICILLLLCTVSNEKKRNMDVEQVYFPFGRPGGGAPNRSYCTNQTELSHGVRSCALYLRVAYI